jgi:hypothetical protein
VALFLVQARNTASSSADNTAYDRFAYIGPQALKIRVEPLAKCWPALSRFLPLPARVTHTQHCCFGQVCWGVVMFEKTRTTMLLFVTDRLHDRAPRGTKGADGSASCRSRRGLPEGREEGHTRITILSFLLKKQNKKNRITILSDDSGPIALAVPRGTSSLDHKRGSCLTRSCATSSVLLQRDTPAEGRPEGLPKPQTL